MATPSSAPVGPSGRQAPRLPGPAGIGQFRPPPPNQAPGQRRPNRRALTKAQQTRVILVCCIAVVLGLLGGLVATLVLPHVYAAETTVRYSLGQAGSADSERTMNTQTVLITSRQVLDSVAQSTSVPLDYLHDNVTATVEPDSELIQIEVRHPDRESGVQLADAIVKRYLVVANVNSDQTELQAQLATATRQLTTPGTPPTTQAQLRSQVSDLQTQLNQLDTNAHLASIVTPPFPIPQAVFPNTPAALGIGLLIGCAAAALIVTNLIRRWTQR